VKVREARYGSEVENFFSRDFTNAEQIESKICEYKDGGLEVSALNYRNNFQVIGNQVVCTGKLEGIDLVNLMPYLMNSEITQYNFCSADLCVTNAGVILSLLLLRNNIEHLDFGTNNHMMCYISDVSYNHIFPIAYEGQKVNNIASEALALKNSEMFMGVIKNNPIKYLGLSAFWGNNMFSLEELVGILSAKSGFTELDYSCNDIFGQEENLIRLYQNRSFKKLDLSRAISNKDGIDKDFFVFLKYTLQNNPQMSLDLSGTLEFCPVFTERFKSVDQRQGGGHEGNNLGHMFEELYQTRTIARYASLPKEIGQILADIVGKSTDSYAAIGGVIVDYYFNLSEFRPEVNILPAIEVSGSCEEALDTESI